MLGHPVLVIQRFRDIKITFFLSKIGIWNSAAEKRQIAPLEINFIFCIFCAITKQSF